VDIFDIQEFDSAVFVVRHIFGSLAVEHVGLGSDPAPRIIDHQFILPHTLVPKQVEQLFIFGTS